MKYIFIDVERNGMSRVQRTDGKWNFIDKRGKILFPHQWFNLVDYFSNGFACVKSDDDEWNFINIKGEILSPIWFNWVSSFRGGAARVRNSDCKWGMIDTNGNIIIDMIFDGLLYLQKYYLGFINGKQYVIDTKWRLHRLLL